FVFFAFRSDRKRDIGDTKGLFWPTLWYLVVATHPAGYWLQLWGIPIPGGSNDPTEGSAIDRYFFLTLTLVGLRILSKRHFAWGGLLFLAGLAKLEGIQVAKPAHSLLAHGTVSPQGSWSH